MQRKKLIFILGILVLVVGVAAFIGGRLFNRQLNPEENQTFIPAEQLPQTPPEVFGLFVRQEDNSLFLGTGGISVDSGANGEAVVTYDGPVLEVVITTRTKLFREIPPLLSLDEIHQKVVEGKINELNETMRLTIWGRKTADRLIADVLLYSSALSFYSDGRVPQPRLSPP
jgi:hypothetical protein